MPVDYLNALNTRGSGLNLSELSVNLARAEINPRQQIYETRITQTETTISALGQLRSSAQDLSDALALAGQTQVRTASSSDAAISVSVTDSNLLDVQDRSISVVQMAQSQVLEFKGFASADAEISAGSLQIDFGIWNGEDPDVFSQNPDRPSTTVTVSAGATLDDLAAQLSTIDGVTAQVVDVGDGTFSLGVSSAMGIGEALRFTATEDPSPSATATSLTTLDNSATNATVQVQASQSAMLQVDGIAVFRSSNTITDVIDGVTLNLNGTTLFPATVSVADDADGTFAVFEALVEQLNSTMGFLDTATGRASETSAAGDLAGDPVAQALERELSSLVSRTYEGFGGSLVSMALVGLTTARDGSLTLDREQFDRAFAADPLAVSGLLRDRLSTSTGEVSGTLYSLDATAGSYAFTQSGTTLQINGLSLSGTVQDDGRISYAITEGQLAGATLVLEASDTGGTLDFGRSFVSTLESRLDDVLSSVGSINRREDALRDAITDDRASIAELEVRLTTIEARYTARFTAMEQIVTELNSTGEYLKNLVDAWNADR